MAAPQSTEEEINKWLKIVTEGEKSGFSAKEYCAKTKIKGKDGNQAPINTKTYSAWKKRLRDLGHDIPESVAAKSTAKKAPAKKAPAKKPSAKSKPKVTTVPPFVGKAQVEAIGDVDTLTIFATLPNGLGLQIKCPTEKDYDKALNRLLDKLIEI